MRTKDETLEITSCVSFSVPVRHVRWRNFLCGGSERFFRCCDNSPLKGYDDQNFWTSSRKRTALRNIRLFVVRLLTPLCSTYSQTHVLLCFSTFPRRRNVTTFMKQQRPMLHHFYLFSKQIKVRKVGGSSRLIPFVTTTLGSLSHEMKDSGVNFY